MSGQVFAALAEELMAIAPGIARHRPTELARFEIAAPERSRAGPHAPDRGGRARGAARAGAPGTLRDALFRRDRSVAREPWGHVARRLGVEPDEGHADGMALAVEATRERGIDDAPSAAFRPAMRQLDASSRPSPRAVETLPDPGAAGIEPAGFASTSPAGDAGFDVSLYDHRADPPAEPAPARAGP